VLMDKEHFIVVCSVSVYIRYSLELPSAVFVVDSPFSSPLSDGKGTELTVCYHKPIRSPSFYI
jgi:hypothetical protein